MGFNAAAAKQAGYSDQEIQGFLQQGAPQSNPQLSLPAQGQGFDIRDTLGLIGGIGGFALGGPVGGLAGGAGGAALTDLLKGKSVDAGNAATQGVLSALPVGKILGLGGKALAATAGDSVIGQLLKGGAKAGGEAVAQGAKVATKDVAQGGAQKGINGLMDFINGGGSKEFIARNAKLADPASINKFALDNNIFSAPTAMGQAQRASVALKDTGTALEKIFKNSSVTFNMDRVATQVGDKLNANLPDSLRPIVNDIVGHIKSQGRINMPANTSELNATGLWNIAKSIDAFGAKGIGARDVGPAYKMLTDEAQREVRQILYGAVPESSGALKAYSAGKELFNTLNDSKGLEVGGLEKILGVPLSAGKAAVNKVAQAAYNKAGAAAPAAEKTAGSALTSGLKGIPAQAVGQAGLRGLVGGQPASADQTLPQLQTAPTDATPSEDQSGGITAEQASLAQLMLEPKEAAKVKAAYDIQELSKKAKTLTPMQQTLKPAKEALSNVTQLLSLGLTGPQNAATQFLIQHLGGAGADQRLVSLNQQFELTKQLVVRALQGSRMSDRDIQTAANYIPSITDTPETAQTKLQNLNQVLASLESQ